MIVSTSISPGARNFDCPIGFTLTEESLGDLIYQDNDNNTTEENTKRSSLKARYCRDDNECFLATSLCSHGCSNTQGSYSCTCPPGFTLGPDGLNCQGKSRVIYHFCI